MRLHSEESRGSLRHLRCHLLQGWIDIPALRAYTNTSERHLIAGYTQPGLKSMDPNDLLTLEVDLACPAAMENQIDAEAARKMRCKVISEGANGPVVPEGDEVS